MKKVAENINYYAMFCPNFDADVTEFELLEQIRRDFFESGKRQKNKIIKEFNGETYHYSYALEDKKPLKWKKMFNGKLTEKSVQNEDGGYSVLFRDDNTHTLKILCFDCNHNWLKSEYFVKDIKGKPLLTFLKTESGINLSRYNESSKTVDEYKLYPVEFSKDNYGFNAISSNLITLFCKTNLGEINYCTDSQIKTLENLKKDSVEVEVINNQKPENIGKGTEDILEYYAGTELEDEGGQEDTIEEMAEAVVDDTERVLDQIAEDIIEADEKKYAENRAYTEVTWEEAINSTKKILLHEDEFKEMSKKMNEKLNGKIIKTKSGEVFFYNGGLDENNGRTGHGRTFNEQGFTAYEGEYSNDKKDGFGVYHYSTGEVFYVGNFESNARNKLGISFKKNRELIHVGAFKNNKLKNMISLFDNNGNLEFAGCVKDGKQMGAGASYNADNERLFVGKYKNGNYTGSGTIFDEKGNLFYTGEFNGSERNGFGTEYNEDATIKYRGQFKENLYNGEGVLYFADGRFIKGRFEGGKVNGMACEYSSRGQKIYEGNFKDNIYNGEGKKYFETGNYLQGNFIDGCSDGAFVEYNEAGEMVYAGNFKEDVYDGYGILFKNGEPLFAGEFSSGKKKGRINELRDGKVIKECVFDDDDLRYVVEYDESGTNLIYHGNILNGEKNGMGCEFSEYAEKTGEGIFENGNIKRRMSVCLNKLMPLNECEELNGYGYDKYRNGPEFLVEEACAGGIYSGESLNGEPNGNGTILYYDHRYTGEFSDGVPEGAGVIYKNDGTQIKGQFFSVENETSEKIRFISGIEYNFKEN